MSKKLKPETISSLIVRANYRDQAIG